MQTDLPFSLDDSITMVLAPLLSEAGKMGESREAMSVPIATGTERSLASTMDEGPKG